MGQISQHAREAAIVLAFRNPLYVGGLACNLDAPDTTDGSLPTVDTKPPLITTSSTNPTVTITRPTVPGFP